MSVSSPSGSPAASSPFSAKSPRLHRLDSVEGMPDHFVRGRGASIQMMQIASHEPQPTLLDAESPARTDAGNDVLDGKATNVQSLFNGAWSFTAIHTWPHLRHLTRKPLVDEGVSWSYWWCEEPATLPVELCVKSSDFAVHWIDCLAPFGCVSLCNVTWGDSCQPPARRGCVGSAVRHLGGGMVWFDSAPHLWCAGGCPTECKVMRVPLIGCGC
jgi:hypothetical protein